jgi:hypothetical protein
MAVGLLKDGINEVIATTASNAAPIGIHLRDGGYRAVLFLGSHTRQNVERDGWLVANIIHDPVIYVRTAFSDLPADAFVREDIGGMEMYRLEGAEAWAGFSARIRRRTTGSVVAELTLLEEFTADPQVLPVNRGFNSIIDATVHATRYRLFHDPGLTDLIEYHAGIVRKCGGVRELEALDLLMSYLS